MPPVNQPTVKALMVCAAYMWRVLYTYNLYKCLYKCIQTFTAAEDATPVGTVFRYDIARNTWAKLPGVCF